MRPDSRPQVAGNCTLLGQVATFMECLHLSYDEVVDRIPYRNLVLMQYDKLHVVHGTLVRAVSGREMRERRCRTAPSLSGK